MYRSLIFLDRHTSLEGVMDVAMDSLSGWQWQWQGCLAPVSDEHELHHRFLYVQPGNCEFIGALL
jgi:hypothetical protein